MRNKEIFLIAGIIATLGVTATSFSTQVQAQCTGNPHDRDSGPTGNPHDPSANGAASGFEIGNPHDGEGVGHHHEGGDVCNGS
jgi:hypothetical protein